MTPEERRELADRLVKRADRIDLDIMERAIPIVPRAEEWSLTLRRAAAALREDADMGQRASDELRERLADAVVIPRDAIPDDLPGDLLEMAEEVSEYRRVLGDHDRLVTAARLLSGGATEGDGE